MKAPQGATRIRQARRALLIGFCILLLAGPASGQAKMDLQAIAQDTQKMAQEPGLMTMVWWLPTQFWQASMEQDPKANKAQIDQVLSTIDPYTVVAIVDGEIGAFGGVTYKSEETIRASVTIKDTAGLSYTPLRATAIDANTKNLLQLVKPIIIGMLGPMGENMHFILFPSRRTSGDPIADPTREGMFVVVLAEKQFKYRLPLGSVLPPKYDPNTKEQFPGNYIFSPFTGTKLVTETN